MTDTTKPTNNIGLALSGGGYRASAFHLGTLNKLSEMRILDKVDVLSTISGGSITGAAWVNHDGDYPNFHNEMKHKLTHNSVISYILKSTTFIFAILFILVFLGGAVYLSFTQWSPWTLPVVVLLFILLMKFQFKIFPVSKVIERAYNKFFYNGATLSKLKKSRPIIAIGSSNLETGRPFTFSQKKMSDSSYTDKRSYDPPIYFDNTDFPVARAVMASSCVPFAFTPVMIDKVYFKNQSDFSLIKPTLVDGGVYDNQGIHKLTVTGSYECKIIITSDAGGNFKEELTYKNTLTLLLRTVNLFMFRIKTSQMVQNVYKNVSGPNKPIAYFSLGWKLDKLIPGFVDNMISKTITKDVLDAHQLPEAWTQDPAAHKDEITQYLINRTGYNAVKARDLTDAEWTIARTTPTNLSCLTQDQLNFLIRQAENLTEIQIKLYCPSLVTI